MGLSKDNKNSSFVVQGLFLAGASLISRIIGLVYRVPLTNIIGKTGNDNYGTAYEIYNLLLIISSYSLPLAISKMVAARISEKRYADAGTVLKLGIWFSIISGTTAFLVVFFGADFFAGSILKTPNAAVALKTLAPALIIVAVMGVIRGFFQGLGTMVPTAISQVVEQIFNAIVSVAAAYMLFQMGLKTSSTEAAALGAAGGTLGTVAGALAGFLFILFLLLAFSKVFKRSVRRDPNGYTETTGRTLSILVMTIVPVLLSTTLYNIISIVDQGIFKNIVLSKGVDALTISEHWGVFTGQYRVIVNIPLAIASALAASIVPSLTASHRRRSGKDVRHKIVLGMRVVSIVSFPCMMGMIALAGPLMQLLFNDPDPVSANMLILGALSVIFYTVSTFTNAVLQGIDRMSKPVVHAFYSLILQGVLLVLLLNFTDLQIYAVVIANIFYAVLMCIFNSRSVKRATRLRMPVRKLFVGPLLASAIMGVVVFVGYQLLMMFIDKNWLVTILCILIGMVVYMLLLVPVGGINEAELKAMPKGGLLVRIFKKLRLLK